MTGAEPAKGVVEEVSFVGVNGPVSPMLMQPTLDGERADGTPDFDKIRAKLAEAVRQATTGRSAAPDDMTPDKRYMYEGLQVLNLPEWNPAPSVKMKQDRIQIAQAARVVDALWEQGWRRHEHLEQKRWVPTPGSTNPRDMGAFIERSEDGSWPKPNPEDFFDPDEITVSETPDGQFCATHPPSGIVMYAASKSRAKLLVSQELLDRIEAASEAEAA